MIAPPQASGFQLVRYFIVASFGAFLLVAIALTYLERLGVNFFEQVLREQRLSSQQVQDGFATQQEETARRDLLAMHEAGNVNLTQLFANTLWAKDFAPLVARAQHVTVDRCRAIAATKAFGVETAEANERKACFVEAGKQIMALPGFQTLDAKVSDMMKESTVFKVKVFDLRGVTVYASEHSQIGDDKLENAGWRSAAAGRPASILTHRGQFNAFEGVVDNRDLISSYLPVFAAGGKKIVGVVEVYADVTPFLDRIKSTSAEIQRLNAEYQAHMDRAVVANESRAARNSNLLLAVVLALLVLLYCGLFLIVRRGQRMIDKQDVERRRAEESLRESDDRHRAILQTAIDGFWLVDNKGCLLEVNATYCRMSGYSEADLLVMRVTDLEAAETAEETAAHIQKVMVQREDRFESRHRRKDGSIFDVEVSVQYRPIEGGRFMVFLQDITARKQAEAAIDKAAQRLQIALEGSQIGIWETDLTCGEAWLDAAWMTFLGGPAAETRIACADLLTLVHPEDRQCVAAAVVQAKKGDIPRYAIEHRVKSANGDWKWIQNRGLVIERDSSGRALRMCGTFTDITERKRVNLAVEVSEARFRALTDLSSDWYWEQDEQYRFTLMSAASLEVAEGASVDAYVGKRRWDFPTLNLNEADWEQHRTALDARQPFRDLLIKRLDARGKVRYLSIGGAPFRDEHGVFRGYRGIGRNITAKVEAEEHILYMAHHDALTGLPNRVLLQDRVGQAVAHAHRSGFMMAVLFLDLDHFKRINDSLGHQGGDKVLKTVAACLADCLREADTVGRFGGDEFLIVLPEIRVGHDAAQVAEKLIDALSLPISCDGQELQIGVSVGISVYPSDGADCQSLILSADSAMYNAKENGRGNYQFFTPRMNVSPIQRLSLENELRHALERDQFLLHYQPQVDMDGGRIIGFEALIRWQRPFKDLMFPGDFIPVTEDAGLIHAVGEWVLRRACREMRAWQLAGAPHLRIAVNVSARQLRREGFLEMVEETLAATGLPPFSLELEITESVILERTDEAAVLLDKCRQLGVHLCLDDFGTGYSSLSYLKRFPVNVLKIDKSFVRDITVNAGDAALISAIVALGHGLGLKVIAEGVETAEQAQRLKALGCTTAQGYYYSRPLPAAQCAALIEAGYIRPAEIEEVGA